MHLGTIKQIFMISKKSAQLDFFLYHARPTDSCTILIQQNYSINSLYFYFPAKANKN